MRCKKIAVFAYVMALGGSAFAFGSEDPKILTEEAIAHIHHVGLKQAFSDFSKKNGEFVYGDLYTFCVNKDGVTVAHGGKPELIGQKFVNTPAPGIELASNNVSKADTTGGSLVKVDETTMCGTGVNRR